MGWERQTTGDCLKRCLSAGPAQSIGMTRSPFNRAQTIKRLRLQDLQSRAQILLTAESAAIRRVQRQKSRLRHLVNLSAGFRSQDAPSRWNTPAPTGDVSMARPSRRHHRRARKPRSGHGTTFPGGRSRDHRIDPQHTTRRSGGADPALGELELRTGARAETSALQPEHPGAEPRNQPPGRSEHRRSGQGVGGQCSEHLEAASNL